MSAPGDVLAVLDDAALCLNTREDREDMRAARAAVAELIAERDALRAERDSTAENERAACAELCIHLMVEAQKLSAYEAIHWLSELAGAIRARGAK